jgi:hypothetical protein
MAKQEEEEQILGEMVMPSWIGCEYSTHLLIYLIFSI